MKPSSNLSERREKWRKEIVLTFQIKLSQLFTGLILRPFENFYTYVATNKNKKITYINRKKPIVKLNFELLICNNYDKVINK